MAILRRCNNQIRETRGRVFVFYGCCAVSLLWISSLLATCGYSSGSFGVGTYSCGLWIEWLDGDEHDLSALRSLKCIHEGLYIVPANVWHWKCIFGDPKCLYPNIETNVTILEYSQGIGIIRSVKAKAIQIPFWSIVVPLLAWQCIIPGRRRIARRRARLGQCINCGYLLKGAETLKCSECGYIKRNE